MEWWHWEDYIQGSYSKLLPTSPRYAGWSLKIFIYFQAKFSKVTSHVTPIVSLVESQNIFSDHLAKTNYFADTEVRLSSHGSST